MKNFPLIYSISIVMVFHDVSMRTTRIEYCGLSNDHHFRKAISTLTGDTDPLKKLNKKALQKICQEVRESSTYTMVKSDEYEDDPALKAIILDENDYKLSDEVAKKEWAEGLEYIVKENLLLRKKNKIFDPENIGVFSCATTDGIRYFHLTNAYFLDGYFFVFNPVYIEIDGEKQMEVRLTGLIEPMTLELLKFRNRRHMEKVFMNSISNPRSKTANDRLCTLNATQQFRLCVAIYDARNSSVVSLNRTKERGHLCVENQRVVIELGIEKSEENSGKYLIKEPRIDVVPCYFNNDRKPAFYLTSDPVREHSVFLLNKNEIKNATEVFTEEVTMTVEGAARDISVLKYAETFY